MRFWGTSTLRCVKSEERTLLERMTANECGSQPALSARSSHLEVKNSVSWKSNLIGVSRLGEAFSAIVIDQLR
jgi:hypothetical protein